MAETDTLTIADLDILIKAVDNWVEYDRLSSTMMGIVFGGMVGGEMGVGFFKDMMAGTKEEMSNRKDTAIVLKAKLLKIKDKLVISEELG